MKPANVELLSGRDIGVSGSYYKPTEKELFDDYLKAIDLLTINGEGKKLEKQVIELKEKSKDNEFLIQARLSEKDAQIKALQDSIKFLSDSVNRVLLADPANKILTSTENDGIVKGIELKPEINNKVAAEIAIPFSIDSKSNNKKKIISNR